MKIKLNQFKTLWQEIFWFGLAVVLGVLMTKNLAFDLQTTTLEPQQAMHPAIYFLLMFGLGTIVILGILKLSKNSNVFKFLLALIVFGGAFNIALVATNNVWVALIAGLFFAAINWVFHNIMINNLSITLGISGLISQWSLSFTPMAIIVILIVLSLYDFWAVYKTKHMIKMAKQLIKSQVFLAYLLPTKLGLYWDELTEKNFKQRQILFLGSGDIALPLLFICTLSAFDLEQGLITALFCLFGLAINQYILIKTQNPIPALPAIAICAIIGFGFSLFF